MYVLSDNDRRVGSGPGKAPRDVPVLFHLLDVTPRQPTFSPEAAPQAASAPLPTAVPPSVVPAQQALVESPLQRTPASNLSAPFSVPLPQLVPSQDSTALTVNSRPEDSTACQVPVPSAAAIEEPAAVSPAIAESPPSGRTPSHDHVQTAPELSVTPKVELPTRRRGKTPASEEWFASHGKFIALGFTAALIATVYLARATRQKAGADVAQTRPIAPLVDETSPVVTAPPTTRASSVEAVASTAPEASPANLAEVAPATSAPKTELQPPAAPQLVSTQPASDNSSQTKDSLFNFPTSKKSDERLAARTDVASQAAANKSAAAAPPLTPAAAPSTAAELAPVYPTTATPQPMYPVASRPVNAYPVTAPPPASNPPLPPPLPGSYGAAPAAGQMPVAAPPPNYRSPYPAAAGPAASSAAPWPPAPAGAAMPAQYQTPYNTATGPRYERTGPGNY